MASSGILQSRFGGYTHTVVVQLLSQDKGANTSRVRVTYDVRRETQRVWGAWTQLNNVTFNVNVNGVVHSANPNFDFRVNDTQRMIDTQQVIAHDNGGNLNVVFSSSSNQLAGSIQFVSSAMSGSFWMDRIPRASTLTRITPNPVIVGGSVTIQYSVQATGYTHRLRYATDTTSGTITSSATTPYAWTPPSSLLGSNSSVDIDVFLDTMSGATVIGTSQLEFRMRAVPVLPTIGEGTPYDIRFRRTVLDGANWELREAIPFIDGSFTDTFSASAICNLTISELAYTTSLENAIVALEVYDGSQWISPDLRFVLNRVEADPTDEAQIVKYTGTSYVDFIYGKGQTDREREFTNTTPGNILLEEVQRAQQRGWGPLIGIDHSASRTSNGTAWMNGDVSMKLQPDTPFLQILDGLVKDVLVEYRTVYKNNKGYLRLMNPGTGSDWATPGADPIINLSTVALHRVGEKSPVRKDYSELLTRVRVRGEEATRVREAASRVNPMFGHLEGSVNASDVTNNARLDQLGDASLTNQASATTERTFSYDLSSDETPVAIYPYRSFRPGDWILVPGDNAPERARVAQIAITRTAAGTKAIITTGDLIPSGLAATARKLTQQNSGASAGGSLRAPAALASAIPAEPANLAFTADGFWDNKGAPKANVELTWDRVTTSLGGTNISVDLYEVWQRPELGSPWVLAGVSGEPRFVVGPLEINQTLDLRVKGRSTAGVYGADSDFLTITTPEPDEVLPAPTSFTVHANAVGTVTVEWDGLIAGSPAPLWFAYARAEISNASAGAYSVAGGQIRGTGDISIMDVGKGTWYVRMVAYDRLGKPGTPSAPISVVVDPVVVDLRQPKAPTALGVTSTGYWNGPNPESGVDAAWTAVTQATDNSTIAIRLYELWGRVSTSSNMRLLASSTTNSVYAAPLAPIGSSYVFAVRAQGANNVWSDFSTPINANIVGPTVAMLSPTTPTLSSGFGLINVNWNGLLGGLVPPAQFRNVYAEMSTTQTGTYTVTGTPLTRDSRQMTITGVAPGQTRWIRLRAVDGMGLVSAPSTAASITVDSVDLGDLDASVNTAITNAQSAATAAGNAAAAAQGTANTAVTNAATAQTTANGKNTVYYQTAMPTGGTYKANDIWFDTDDGNRLYVHNGTTFVAMQFGTSAITDSAITAAKILDGTISATELSTAVNNSITAAQTTANGKNTIYYQAAMPTGGTYKANDIWFDTDDGNRIYVHNGTTFVTAQLGTNAIAALAITDALIANGTITNAKIANLDAAKITTGTLDANRIGADSITAKHLLIGDFSNMVPDPLIDLTLGDAWTGTAVQATTVSGSLRSLRALTNNAATSSSMSLVTFVPVQPDKRYYLEGEILRSSGTVDLGVQFYTDAKVAVGTPVIVATRTTGTGFAVLGGEALAPATAAYAKVVGTGTGQTSPNHAGWTGLVMRQKAGGELLVDGSITAAKMVAGTITAASGILADAVITNAKIANGAVDNAKIANLDAGKINAGTIAAARIGAGSITADKMLVGDMSNMAEVGQTPTGNTVSFAGVTMDSPGPAGGWFQRSATTGIYHMFRNQKGPLPFHTGERLRVSFEAYASATESVELRLWTYTSGGTNANQIIGSIFNLTTNPQEFAFETEVTVDTDDKVSFLVGINNILAGVQTYVRNVRIHRMNAGELIVDGSILAGKLAANAVVAENIQAGSITTGKLAAGAVTANEIAANTITANQIAAGTISADLLTPALSDTISLSAAQVEILATQVSDVEDTATANASQLQQLQTRYSFTPSAAVISQPGSAFRVEISNTQLSFIEGSDVRASLNAGVFDAPQMATEQLRMTWHILEDDPSGTVWRRAS